MTEKNTKDHQSTWQSQNWHRWNAFQCQWASSSTSAVFREGCQIRMKDQGKCSESEQCWSPACTPADSSNSTLMQTEAKLFISFSISTSLIQNLTWILTMLLKHEANTCKYRCFRIVNTTQHHTVENTRWERLQSTNTWANRESSSFFLFFFFVPQLYLWGSPLLGEIFAYVTVF